MISRRDAIGRLIRPLAFPLLGAALPGALRAAGYPERAVRIIVGLAAGASTDLLARQLGRRLAEQLGQQFIIENKPGAATRIGMETVARAPADGYTLAVANAVSANFPSMFPDFEFVPGKDFTPVAMLGRAPSYLAVRANLPAANVKEFVAYAKANSGKLSFGQGGNGSNPHLASLTLVRSLGIQATEVAYKGNAPTAAAVAAGEVDFALLDYPSARPFVERGNLRLLAVTEARRVASTPEIPTSGEQGLTREIDGMTPWFMLIAPAATPQTVVSLLNRNVVDALKSAELQRAINPLGIEVQGGTTAQALTHFNEQRTRMAQLARELGVSLKG